jgi:hypothetical protein
MGRIKEIDRKATGRRKSNPVTTVAELVEYLNSKRLI